MHTKNKMQWICRQKTVWKTMRWEGRKTIDFTQFHRGWCMSAFLFHLAKDQKFYMHRSHWCVPWHANLSSDTWKESPETVLTWEVPGYFHLYALIYRTGQSLLVFQVFLPSFSDVKQKSWEQSNKLCQELSSIAAHPGCLTRKTALTNWLLKDRTSCWSLLWSQMSLGCQEPH